MAIYESLPGPTVSTYLAPETTASVYLRYFMTIEEVAITAMRTLTMDDFRGMTMEEIRVLGLED